MVFLRSPTTMVVTLATTTNAMDLESLSLGIATMILIPVAVLAILISMVFCAYSHPLGPSHECCAIVGMVFTLVSTGGLMYTIWDAVVINQLDLIVILVPSLAILFSLLATGACLICRKRN